MASYKGWFKPKHPHKYIGDPTQIIYRSSWENKLFNYLDIHPDVIGWCSEEIIVPYVSPIDNRIHRYFPDVLVKRRNKDGIVETLLIEVKPKSQTTPPEKQSKKTKRYINEVFTWGVNEAKWKAAQAYCDKKGWKFLILTEDHLGIK